MNMGFGKLFLLDSSNASIDIFKALPDLDTDIDTTELFKLPIPFVLLVQKNYCVVKFSICYN